MRSITTEFGLLCGPNTITNDGPYNQKCTGGDTPEWQAQRMQWCVPYSNIMAHTSYGQHTAIQGATQFVYTYQFQPYTGPGSFANTAWTSVYHYQGRSIAGFNYDLGNEAGNPSTGGNLGSPSSINFDEKSVTTNCNSTNLCMTMTRQLDPDVIGCPLNRYSGTYVHQTYSHGCGSVTYFYGGTVRYQPGLTASNPVQSLDTGVWCDAPSDASNPQCTGNGGEAAQEGLGQVRGCMGYGICPKDLNSQVCGNNGVCLNNAKCKCDPGYGGLACDKQIPQVSPPHNYSCAQFDPCSEQGQCLDSPTGPQCICYEGWRGSPWNGITLGTTGTINGEINIYNHAFFCKTTNCVGYQQALDYMIDHQCLFFVDPDGTLIARYLRQSSSVADMPQGDARSSNPQIAAPLPYTFQPLWYSGDDDIQLIKVA
ncbi:unnamed protein product [Sphagnum balticum]